MSEINKKLILFDFDGTITTKDTFPLYFKYTFGNAKFLFYFFLLSPLYLFYKIRLLSAGRFKSIILSTFLKGQNKNNIETSAKKFINFLFESKVIKPKFIEKIKNYKAEGAIIAIVSASPDIWINPFCEKYDIMAISTNLNFTNGYFTGKIKGNNCSGPEKKQRILSTFDLASFSEIVVYGNSKGDNEMMELATVKNWI